MFNNFIGGFNICFEVFCKYFFGCVFVYGINNDFIIEGVFVICGDDYVFVFDVVFDYESYEFIKFDFFKFEDCEYVDVQWIWEKFIVENGKEYFYVFGKVFK